ncbi:hypothetical protein AAG906_031620 [Vitis piasezkii]
MLFIRQSFDASSAIFEVHLLLGCYFLLAHLFNLLPIVMLIGLGVQIHVDLLRVGELGFPHTTSIPLHADNTNAIQIGTDPAFHERTKHIEVFCHSIRDTLESWVISLSHISSDLQVADVFTKALTRQQDQFLVGKLFSAYRAKSRVLEGEILEVGVGWLEASFSWFMWMILSFGTKRGLITKFQRIGSLSLGDGIFVNQHKYIQDLITLASLEDTSSVDTPMEVNIVFLNPLLRPSIVPCLACSKLYGYVVFLRNLGFQTTSTPLYLDNTSHIEVFCHSIRDTLESRVISLSHISSDLQVADVFTKALTRQRHQFLVGKLLLVDLPASI